MANYNAAIRTNYFSVTHEKKFRNISDSCCGEDTIHVLEAVDGSAKLGFECNGSIVVSGAW